MSTTKLFRSSDPSSNLVLAFSCSEETGLCNLLDLVVSGNLALWARFLCYSPESFVTLSIYLVSSYLVQALLDL